MLRLTLDALQVVDAIERRGSFAAAADELHRTTSTLSYTVKKLEDDLGVQLFDRSGHRAKLTDAGRLLLDEGRGVLDAARAMERRVRSLGDGWEAELEIAVNDLVPLETVLAAVADFYRAGHPTRIRMRTEVLGGVWESLVSRRADVAVTELESRGAPDITHRPIGSLPFVFAVAPDHPLAREKQPIKVATIRRHRVVVVADSARGGAPRSTGIAEAADVLTVSSLHAKLAAQVAGLGVGFLPEPIAAMPIAQGQLVPLQVAAPKPRLQLSVAWRGSEGGPALSWFVERLQSIDLTAPGSLAPP
ncbi:LysR family transcriptional regulator [Piscinibacter gummiphilus]|uniref:LysR family transcriptional regulator n=1 Tax=Piscinibacter gummiphilus TaxID=946333 RepID=A0ABZ0CNL7_9BURK|nr:LysR family transcriptional regulator [Piscinibacter gummiphilus]WOB06111.1 LysR family transcriptional regulator [Piscinibacter gummiphilus]